MARKSIELQLNDRGNPLVFVVKEMSATELERWIIRAVLLVSGSNAATLGSFDVSQAGALLAEKGLGLLGNVDYEKAKPLLDDLLGCCYRKIEKHQERCTPESVDGYIEDVATLFKLRTEALKLNLGFLQAGDEPLLSSRDTPNIVKR